MEQDNVAAPEDAAATTGAESSASAAVKKSEEKDASSLSLSDAILGSKAKTAPVDEEKTGLLIEEGKEPPSLVAPKQASPAAPTTPAAIPAIKAAKPAKKGLVLVNHFYRKAAKPASQSTPKSQAQKAAVAGATSPEKQPCPAQKACPKPVESPLVQLAAYGNDFRITPGDEAGQGLLA